jgi:hypothetical protein
MARFLREFSIALPIAVLLAVALTWPLAPDMASSGRVDSGDARHGIWNVAWVARALTSDPRTLFDANIFYPHDNALAFSEGNIVAGVMAVPVWLITHDGLAAANSAILLSFVFSALALFALARYLTGHVGASAIAALMFAYSPYAFARLAHMQLLMTFGLPLTMLALHRFVDRPGARRALVLGAAMAVTALSCGYYGIFVGLSVVWGFVWFATTGAQWRSGRYWLLCASALGTAAVLTGPFMLPYAGIRDEGFARSLADARLFSADWQAYLASAKLVHDWMLPLLGEWNDVLFPGFLALIFGITAVVQSARRSAGAAPRAMVGFYSSLVGLAAWASFGPDAGLYAALFNTLPFFELIRAPARFGVLVTLGVTTLAAMSMATLLRRLDGSPRRLTLVALSAATLATSTVGPLTLVERRPPHRVYERLAHMPRGPVVEFPYFVTPQERHRHTEYMFESLRHWQPLINGYSDHTPPEAAADGLVLARFPSKAAWDVLRRRGARYVVMHWESYPPDSHIRRELFARDVGVRLRLVVDASDLSLFEVMADASPGR